MVNFLKSIFKPISARRNRETPSPTYRDTRQNNVTAAHYESGRGSEQTEGTMRRLLEVLEDIETSKDDGRITPFYASKRDSTADPSQNSTSSHGRRLLDVALQACTDIIARVSDVHLLGRMVSLLEAQRDEMEDMRPFVHGRFPSLVTLEQIYTKIDIEVENITKLPETNAKDTLATLVQVLQEGPDYLIDVCLLSAIVWYAEIIDPSFAAGIRQILDKAIENKSNLVTFRKASESVVGLCTSLSADVLDDQESRDAYEAIHMLLKLLQARVVTSVKVSSTSALSSTVDTPPTPLTLPVSPFASPALSLTGGSSSFDPNVRKVNMDELQANFGSGVATPSPLPGLSSYNPTPGTQDIKRSASPAKSEAESDESEEIWEYRGQLLTRSALDLVLRQEALAQADSSGQYAGGVSWDSLRNAWIPQWAKKLKVSDLAEGEVPDTNPLNFEEKETDEWDNKIGWYGVNKEMFYKEDPKWELKD
ncbi:hypothetical protein L204_105392 [Cryptococcus depauperatus]